MPPGVSGHYRPNLSNPFNQFPQPHNNHAANSHYQHQAFPSQSFNSGAFPAPAGQSQNGIFGGGLSGGSNGSFGAAIGGAGLASHEAQMRFARGAIQEQHAQMQADGLGNVVPGAATRGSNRIREVYKHNLAREMAMIRSLVDRYPYISMDTEFPGVVARPMGNFPSKADYHYQCLRCNVDLLKLIQLGITLFSVEGDLPPTQADTSLARSGYPNNLVPCPCTWTFNFQFSLEDDMYSQDSIDMLQKAGVDFAKCKEMGIDPKEFGSLLITSGLVLDPDVSWLSFHSGYDFGYLMKMMMRTQLPADEEEYLNMVRIWFPRIYDIKFLFRHAQTQSKKGVMNTQTAAIVNALGQRSGLQDIADELDCQREGRPHTAGSDAWLTGLVFWALRNKVFENSIPEELVGKIWGLSGVGPPASSATQAAALAGHQTPNINGASVYSGMTPSAYRNDPPTTPAGNQGGIATGTPGANSSNYGVPGGAFGNFQYGR